MLHETTCLDRTGATGRTYLRVPMHYALSVPTRSLTLRCNAGVAEAGWTMDELNAQNRRKRDGDALAVNKELLAIWRELEKHDVAWVFREPVDLTEVTDYTSIIERPIGEGGGEGGGGSPCVWVSAVVF